MPLHIVKQGECLSSIAANYGFEDWHTIYDDPANAGFRAKRPDHNVIYPGDELFIPDADPGHQDMPTDARHVFSLKRAPTYLNIHVQDPSGHPIRNAPYKLWLGTEEFDGQTDGDGWINKKIPPTAEFGSLTVWPDPQDRSDPVTWRVQLGHLDPLETISGVKGRLNNLGYHCGEVNDKEDRTYDSAVRRFQNDHGLVVDGIVGPKTKEKLKQEHRL